MVEQALKLAESAEFMAAPPSNDMSVYKQKMGDPNFDVHPSEIFFYYARFNGSSPDINCYHFDNHAPILCTDVESYIRDMALDARRGRLTPCAEMTGLSGSKWRVRNYFVLLMDDPNWRLCKSAADATPALAFDIAKGSTPNHTFFDGKDIDVDVTGGGVMRSAFYMVNHLRYDAAGSPIPGNGQQDFVFNVYYKVSLVGGGTTTMIDDPTGTNLGPPN